jgi:hypothetical protein
MAWDLTQDEADKFNKLSRGESVDLTQDEQQKFQPIFAEKAKLGPAQGPDFSELALGALKEIGSSLFTPRREEAQMPDVAQLRAQGVPDEEIIKRQTAPAHLNALRALGAGLSAFDIKAQNLLPEKYAKGANQFLQEGAETYPKLALGVGLLAPFPSEKKMQAAVAGGLGAIHGFANAPEGADLRTKAKYAAVSGGLNAGLALGLGHLTEGAGNLLGPKARALLAKMGMDADRLAGEPRTVVETPEDQMARQAAVNNARGGQPPAVQPQQPLPPNLAQVWDVAGVTTDPQLTKASINRGALTRNSYAPEPQTYRDALAERRTPEDLRAEPVTVTEPLTVTEPMTARMQRAQTLEEKLAVIQEMNAERPTYVEKNPILGDPRVQEQLRESGYWEAYNESQRGNNAPLEKWFKENPHIERGLRDALLPLARGYRLRHGAEARTDMPTASLRDEQGTNSLRAPGSPRPVSVMIDELLSPEVGLEKTKTKYLPADYLHPESVRDPDITHIASNRLQPPIGGGSGRPPSQAAAVTQGGPPVSAPLTPDDLHAQHMMVVKAAQEMLQQDQSFRAKALRQLSLPEHRGDELLGHAVLSVKASNALAEARLKYFHPRMEEALKGLTSNERARVESVMTRLRDRKATLADVNTLPKEFRELFQQSQKEIQGQQLALAQAGYFNPNELASMAKTLRDGHLWQHRAYLAFEAKKPWLKEVVGNSGAIDEAARFFQKSDPSLSWEDAVGQVRGVIKDIADGAAAGGPRTANDIAAALRDRGILKGRTLPPQLRNLLGVINDPALMASQSAAHMAAMFHLMNRTKALMAPEYRGKVWSDNLVPGMDPRKLWDPRRDMAGNKQLFGELAGKYVDPALREAMLAQPPHATEEMANQFVKRVNGWFSVAHVLTSPVTWARNFLSNGFYMAVSGMSPTAMAKYTLKAMQMLVASNERGVGAGVTAHDLVQMAIEDGGLKLGKGTDFAGGSEARRILELAVSGRKEGLLGMYDRVFRGMQEKLGNAYEFFDQSARLAGYLYHLEAANKTLGLNDTLARAHASHVVNRYFATGAGVPPVISRFKQYTLGAAPFLGWHADNLRVAKNIIADGMQGKVAPAVRAAAFMAFPYAISKAAQMMNGISDDDIAAGDRMLKPTWAAEHPLHVWLPMRGRDGKLVYAVSLDGINPMATFLKGDKSMGIPQKLAANTISGFFQSGALEPFVDQQLAMAGIQPEQYQPKLAPGQEGYATLNAIGNYMQPALVRMYRDMVRKAQLSTDEPLRPTEEPMSAGEALLTRLSPLAMEKVGARTAVGAARQKAGAVGELRDAIKRIARETDPAAKQRELKAARERAQQLRTGGP